MNKYFTLSLLVSAIIFCGCDNKKTSAAADSDSTAVTSTIPDTAYYGTVGEGTTMHLLVLNTEDGKKLEFEYNNLADNEESSSEVQGGIFEGDRITLTAHKSADSEALVVTKAVNITTLLGKWTSLARNFTIKEEGVVESSGAVESNPYTQWTMTNAQLVLNTDTFDVLQLGADSISLENAKGIFVYKRGK